MTTTPDRLQAAATILAGMLVALSNSDPEAEDLPSINACAQGAWKHFAALEAAAPEPAGKMPEVQINGDGVVIGPMPERVEPTKQEWMDAAETMASNQPTWQYCQGVSAEAYRLAALRVKG